MAGCVEIDKAWGFNILCDWYINSIDETDPPCWTPEHIDELTDDFYVIPKRKEIAAPVFDAEPVVRCKDCKHWHTDEILKTSSCRILYDGNGFEKMTDAVFFCGHGVRKGW